MLTKETKKTAEELAQKLAPLFATADKLGEKLQKAAKETRKAHDVATAWQYPSHPIYAEDCGEDSQTIQNLKENSPHEWSEELHKKYNILSEKETAEKCARLNYRNYLQYIADTIANELHKGDTWAQFYEKKGIETLADLIREHTNKKGASVGIYRDGTGWEAFGHERFYCYFNIRLWGACGMSAKNWGTYSEITKHEGRAWEEPKEPKLYTIAQYCREVAKLKELENKAKQAAREHHERARASGLIYFIGGLSDPKLETWGQRD